MNTRFTNLVLTAVCLGLAGTLGFTLNLLRKSKSSAAAYEALVVTNTVTQTQISVRKINPSNLLAALANRPLSWGAIESTNYMVYIANLRSIGCPEETIKDVILTDVAKVYARRRAALRSSEPYQFWRTETSYPADPQKQEVLRLLDREQTALVHELLNVDFQAEMGKYFDDAAGEEDRMYSFLPEEKRSQLAELQAHYDQLEEAIYSRAKGIVLPEDEAELKKLQSEKEKQLATLLTPQELEEYGLRSSPTAVALRSQLQGFEPTEDEFRKIYRLQKTFDSALNADPANPASEATRARVEEATSLALVEEIKKTLGDKRFSEYVRTQDEDYRHLVQLSQRLDLPPEVASRVYDMRQTAELQKQRVESDANLTSEQRQRALAALGQETENALNSVMGGKPFAAYRHSGASWLDELRQSQVPAPVEQPEAAAGPPPPFPPGFNPFLQPVIRLGNPKP